MIRVLRAFFASLLRRAPEPSPGWAWRAAPLDHLLKFSEHFDRHGRYKFKDPELGRLAAMNAGAQMSTGTATFTSSGTWVAPSNLVGGSVTVQVVGGRGLSSGAYGAAVSATLPWSASEQMDITVASGQTGYHNGGGTNDSAASAGGGSSAVVRHDTSAVEIEAGGGGGNGAPSRGYSSGEFTSVGGQLGSAGGTPSSASTDGSDGASPTSDGAGGTTGVNHGTAGSSGVGGTGGASFAVPGTSAGVGGGGGGGGGVKGGGGGSCGRYNEGEEFGSPYVLALGGYGGAGGASFVASDATAVSYSTASKASVIISYSLTEAPFAPTLVSPANGSTIDAADAGVTLSAIYNQNPTSGPLQKVLVRVNTGSGYKYWTGSVLSSTATWIVPTTGAGATDGQTFTVAIASGIFSDPSTVNWNHACQEATSGLQGSFAGTDFVFVSEEIPTVTLTAPAPIVESTSPVIAWTTVIPGGETQTSYRALVYDLAATLVGGFVPGAAPLGYSILFDTGTVGTSSTPTDVPITGASLLNGNSYVAFVQVAAGSALSGWQSVTFTVQLDAPQPPTISVVPSTDPATGNPGNLVLVVANDNGLTLDGSSFEASTGGWSASNAALSQTTSWQEDGGSALKIESTASGVVKAWAAERVPVVGSASVGFMATVRAAGTVRSITLLARFYDSTDTLIGSDETVDSANDSSVGVELSGALDAPSNAVSADVVVEFTAGGASEEHDVDEAGIFPNGLPSAWSIGGLLGEDVAEVQYSDDQVTWADLRYGAELVPISQEATVLDQETPFNVPRYYRARMYAFSGGQEIASAWSAVESAVCVSVNWWVSVPDFLTDLVSGFLYALMLWRQTPTAVTSTVGSASAMLSGGLTPSLQVDEAESLGVFKGLGRKTSIVVSDVVQGQILPALTLGFDNDADFQTFRSIRALQRTLLFRSDMGGEVYYARIGAVFEPVTVRSSDRMTNPKRQLTVELLPVDIP